MGKEKETRGEENETILPIFIRKQHNETHRMLFERGGRGTGGNRNIIEGVHLAQGTLYACIELSQ
jgi:hypothetical protein